MEVVNIDGYKVEVYKNTLFGDLKDAYFEIKNLEGELSDVLGDFITLIDEKLPLFFEKPKEYRKILEKALKCPKVLLFKTWEELHLIAISEERDLFYIDFNNGIAFAIPALAPELLAKAIFYSRVAGGW